jgi:hypothetical protein
MTDEIIVYDGYRTRDPRYGKFVISHYCSYFKSRYILYIDGNSPFRRCINCKKLIDSSLIKHMRSLNKMRKL